MFCLIKDDSEWRKEKTAIGKRIRNSYIVICRWAFKSWTDYRHAREPARRLEGDEHVSTARTLATHTTQLHYSLHLSIACHPCLSCSWDMLSCSNQEDATRQYMPLLLSGPLGIQTLLSCKKWEFPLFRNRNWPPYNQQRLIQYHGTSSHMAHTFSLTSVIEHLQKG